MERRRILSVLVRRRVIEWLLGRPPGFSQLPIKDAPTNRPLKRLGKATYPWQLRTNIHKSTSVAVKVSSPALLMPQSRHRKILRAVVAPIRNCIKEKERNRMEKSERKVERSEKETREKSQLFRLAIVYWLCRASSFVFSSFSYRFLASMDVRGLADFLTHSFNSSKEKKFSLRWVINKEIFFRVFFFFHRENPQELTLYSTM